MCGLEDGGLDALQAATRGQAIVTTDVGQHQMWAANRLRFDLPRRWLTSGGLGTMGFGFPAAIGAALAEPGVTSMVIAGDGDLAEELAEAAIGAGWDVAAPEDADGEVPALIVDCGGHHAVLQGGPQLLLCHAAPLAAQDPGGPSAGFHLLAPFGRLATFGMASRQPTKAIEPGALMSRSRGVIGFWLAHCF